MRVRPAGRSLDTDAAMAHQAHERGPQLAWRPAVSHSRYPAYPPEHLPDVGRVEGGAEMGSEHQRCLLPSFTGQEPFFFLAFLQRTPAEARVLVSRILSPLIRHDAGYAGSSRSPAAA